MTLRSSHTFEALGTQWEITTTDPIDSDTKHLIAHTINDFTAAYSRFDPTSLVMQAATTTKSITFPPSIAPLLDTYQLLSDLSDGAINPLVGHSLEAIGYDAAYSLTPHGAPQAAPSLQTLERVGSTLQFQEPALLDIGAVGKGFLVDEISAIIAKHHTHYIVDASGDLRVHAATPERIGLEHPSDPKRVIGVVELTDNALCASAPNRRTWGNGLHHIIDARTGLPIHSTIIATWAIASSTQIADALTTGLFFADYATLKDAFGEFQYVIMKADQSVEYNIHQIGEIFS